MPAGLFDPLTKVTQLNLREFFLLDSLPADTFSAMSALRTLDFWDFGVRNIDVNAFRGLGSLTRLYVAAAVDKVHTSSAAPGAVR